MAEKTLKAVSLSLFHLPKLKIYGLYKQDIYTSDYGLLMWWKVIKFKIFRSLFYVFENNRNSTRKFLQVESNLNLKTYFGNFLLLFALLLLLLLKKNIF